MLMGLEPAISVGLCSMSVARQHIPPKRNLRHELSFHPRIFPPQKSVSVETASPWRQKKEKTDSFERQTKSLKQKFSPTTFWLHPRQQRVSPPRPTRVYVFPLQCIAPHHSNFHLSETKILPGPVQPDNQSIAKQGKEHLC